MKRGNFNFCLVYIKAFHGKHGSFIFCLVYQQDSTLRQGLPEKAFAV
jgi:hypothetical protein